jgi:hypothetical protein
MGNGGNVRMAVCDQEGKHVREGGNYGGIYETQRYTYIYKQQLITFSSILLRTIDP